MDELIDELAEIILKDNKSYLGSDISDAAIAELERIRRKIMKFLKRRQKQETNQQINNEEELGTLKAQTIKELIAPSGIDASK